MRTPEQIIGEDLAIQLVFEGYMVVRADPTPEAVGAWYRVKNGHHFAGDPEPTDTSDYAAYRALVGAAATAPKEGS
jgi:hypothetical protein